HTMNPEPVMQPVPQQIAQQLPLETPQPVYDMNRAHMQSGPNAQAIQEGFVPHGGTMQPYPQQPAYQPEAAPYSQQQVRQPTNGHIPNGTIQVQNGNGREYQTAPAAHDTFCFDPEDENDRELLREDPYAEYPDFPAEYRMKDEAQVEMVYC
ncbi:PRTRC system protein E, partial [Phocaeicola vulgatus]